MATALSPAQASPIEIPKGHRAPLPKYDLQDFRDFICDHGIVIVWCPMPAGRTGRLPRCGQVGDGDQGGFPAHGQGVGTSDKGALIVWQRPRSANARLWQAARGDSTISLPSCQLGRTPAKT